jgi:hypothetical protein
LHAGFPEDSENRKFFGFSDLSLHIFDRVM